MNYDLIETSDALGEPLDLYRFSYGGGAANIFCYTDADFEIIHAGDVYQPAPIERGSIVTAETLDKASLDVTLPHDTEVAELFLTQPPAATVALTVFRCHWDADAGAITPPQTIWIGRVLGCSREDYLASLSCEPASTSLHRIGLRRHYQYMCPHVLYGPHCRAQAGNHQFLSSPVAVDQRSITVSGEWGDQFLGGMLAWQPVGQPTERRTILQRFYNAGNMTTRFVLAGGVRKLRTGDEIELFRGCKHTLGDCRDVFNNAPNFGGTPFIPTQNPHGTTAIYN